MVFRCQDDVPSSVSKISLTLPASGYVRPSRRRAEVPVEHLVVPRLVDHLGGLEELGVLPVDVLDHLAAHEHGAVLAVDQRRQTPLGDAAVQLDPLVGGEPVPEFRAVDVDEVVGDQAALAGSRGRVQSMSVAAFHWSRLACS